ncbi:MAG: oligoendopeptidase [Armatimonadota bacterium]
MSTPAVQDPSMTWDLTHLFAGPDDPRIGEAFSEAENDAKSLAERYRGRIVAGDLTPTDLRDGIQRLEDILERLSRVASFANLRFTEDTSDPKRGAFLQSVQERLSEIHVLLLFFELELQAAPEQWVQGALSAPELANYRHWLQRVRVYSPHRLSESEEVLLERTANTGVRAWQRLHEEVVAGHPFRYRDPKAGDIRTTNLEELTSLLRESDRDVRQAAADSLTEGLKEIERVVVFCYNTILADRKLEDELRRFSYPEQSRNIANELDQETVELVVQLCAENHPLVERYYLRKRDLLGLPELTHVDRYAPLKEASARVPYHEAKEIVLGSFRRFSEQMASIAGEFFEGRWIDAQPRMGKASGAFCEYVTPKVHPYILMSYQERLDDVMTLAHELGHGMHAYLSRAQTLFNLHGTLPLAELASIFGEMLVFDDLVRNCSDEDRLALYAQKIEGIFASVFRQAAMFRFEKECHQIRREEGELSADEFAEIWQSRLQEMFGAGVTLGEQHKHWWLYVGHFFFAPFYVYAYAFGELLSLSLYQRAKTEGASFAERYLDVLRLGGSRSPQELMSLLDVDLTSAEFWRGGFQVIEGMISQFEGLSTKATR